jgi:hypothetical protein
MDSDDKSADERRTPLERRVKEYRATLKRRMAEVAEKLWLEIERQRPRIARYQPPAKLH